MGKNLSGESEERRRPEEMSQFGGSSERAKEGSLLAYIVYSSSGKEENQGKTVEPADGRDGLEIAQIKPNYYFYAWLFVRALPRVLCFL